MITFKYDLNQDVVELQASDWCGLEQVYINGKRVSRKLNFGQNSEHNIQLDDGNNCKFQLLIDPSSEQMVCRIYKRNNLIASIKQGKKNLLQSRKSLQNWTIFFTLSSLLLLLLN
ncbi:hypothetical protein HWQ46_07585 [Shewanella sp. D64]|uniref:hypothetical protein n=1 Tax=unclassified Shewanella TaxID=196818 RepID=UPI0022BA4558|nr:MULTISPECIES: hypothetical protein [unclassified Shewanella]MEC4725406.1 hypothetical protein [Shewanella sp. D64]MEC4735748.1 hypothetical protein [Shewanella sp. E94]WBJ93279.1 hypothetical protein HWQ47_15085 [Shewanella sp. MTB7]